MLRLLLPSLLLLLLIACPGGDSALPPPFPPSPALSSPVPTSHASPFQVEPYLQLGAGPSSPDRLALLWHAQDGPGDWAVEIKPQDGEDWVRMARPVSALVEEPAAGADPHRVWTATLTPLEPGLPFDYRVLQDGTEVFRAEGKALKAPGQPQQVVVAGDLASGDSLEAAAMVRQIHLQNPDLMVAAGDLVPQPYRRTFFSIYNAGRTDPKSGAPFMRGTVLVGAPSARDAGAYHAYWNQPQEGPSRWAGQVHGRPAADGGDPGLDNFCFHSGDVHWTVLGSNWFRHWDDPRLKPWLARELAAAQAARWRFVVFPRPASEAATGRGEAGMKALWPLLRKYHVALVFSGRQQLVVSDSAPGPGPGRTGPAQGAPCFSLLSVTASRVVCRRIDGRGAALGSFTLSR